MDQEQRNERSVRSRIYPQRTFNFQFSSVITETPQTPLCAENPLISFLVGHKSGETDLFYLCFDVLISALVDFIAPHFRVAHGHHILRRQNTNYNFTTPWSMEHLAGPTGI